MKAFIRASAIFIAVAGVCLLLADTSFAQCVMCRASLGGNPAFVRNLNLGVLVLLAPPVSLFCAFFFILFRHRK